MFDYTCAECGLGANWDDAREWFDCYFQSNYTELAGKVGTFDNWCDPDDPICGSCAICKAVYDLTGDELDTYNL